MIQGFTRGSEPQTFGLRAPKLYQWATVIPPWSRSITNLQKGVDRPVENPRKSAENIKMMPNAPNKFYRRTRRQNAPLLEFSIWRTAIPSDWYSITQAQYGKCAKCTKCMGVLCQTNLHPSYPFEIVIERWSKGLQEEANLKPSDSALRYFINEPHKFHLDRGLLRIWRRNITEIKLRSKRYCHIPRRSRSHLPNNHAQQLQAYSDHSASWWTDITTKRTRGTASWFPMSIEISF